MSHDNLVELPGAATSFIAIRKAPCGWNVVLTTPAGPKALRTVLHRAADRDAAVAKRQDIAATMMRPFKVKGVIDLSRSTACAR